MTNRNKRLQPASNPIPFWFHIVSKCINPKSKGIGTERETGNLIRVLGKALLRMGSVN